MNASPRALVLALSLSAFPASALAQTSAAPWRYSLRLFTSHDSNAPLESNETASMTSSPRRGFLGGVVLTADGPLANGREWRVTAGATASGSRYIQSDLDDYDNMSLGMRVEAVRPVRLGTRRAAIALGGNVRHDWLGGESFAQSEQLRCELRVTLAPRVIGRVYYEASLENFNDDTDTPDVWSRDANQHRLGCSVRLPVGDARRTLTLGYGFSHNDADGTNYVFNAHGLNASFASPLAGPFSVRLDAAWSHVDYTDYEPAPRRKQDNLNLTAVLQMALGPRLSADVFVTRNSYDANTATFSAGRTRSGGGITYRF